MNPLFLRRKAAAEYLRTRYGFGSYQTLAKAALDGSGPQYRKAGSCVLYEVPALDIWAEKQIGPPRTSTSDLGGAL